MTQSLAGLDFTQLSSQIEELNAFLVEFQGQLHTEAELLKSNNTPALSESTETKINLTEKIDSQVKQINRTLSQNNVQADFFELANQKAFQQCPNALQSKVEKTLSLTQICHDLNMANGMSIQILSNINQVSLQILTGQNQTDANLYGSSGVTTQSKSKSSLGKA